MDGSLGQRDAVAPGPHASAFGQVGAILAIMSVCCAVVFYAAVYVLFERAWAAFVVGGAVIVASPVLIYRVGRRFPGGSPLTVNPGTRLLWTVIVTLCGWAVMLAAVTITRGPYSGWLTLLVPLPGLPFAVVAGLLSASHWWRVGAIACVILGLVATLP